MTLSRIAQELASEIASQDWSDSPWRLDRAGHRIESDSPSKRSAQTLTPDETGSVRTNVMWVTAQVLAHADPNFDVHEYAVACGVPRRYTHRSNNMPNGMITSGIRFDRDGRAADPLEVGD